MAQSTNNKSTSTPNYANTNPTWATPGTSEYNNMNQQLQTAPMNAAVQTFQNGGMTPATTAAANTNSNIANAGGTNANLDWAADKLKGIDTSGLQSMLDGMGNPATISTDNWQSVYNKSGQPGANEQYLANTANGSMLTSNPYIDEMIRNAQNEAADYTDRMFASGGRYGSGSHQGTVANEVGKIGTELRYNNYNTERDRQMAAAGAISGEQSNRLGLQGTAASGISNIDQANVSNKMNSDATKSNIAQAIANIQQGQASGVGGIGQNQLNNQMGAAGNAAAMENQGFANILNMISQLPTIQGNKTFDSDKQASIGNAIDQMSQGQLDDLINTFTQMDQEEWARLGALFNAGTTSAGNYGTQTQTTKQPMNILGALGTMFSGFQGSDEKIKKNVKKVGETPGGHDVVEYDLRDSHSEMMGVPKAPKKVGILGVIAQDAKKKQPNAVKKTKGGLLAVDYSKIK